MLLIPRNGRTTTAEKSELMVKKMLKTLVALLNSLSGSLFTIYRRRQFPIEAISEKSKYMIPNTR